MSDLQALLRYQILDERNSGEPAKHALMRAAADHIAELEHELQEQARLNGMGSEREAKQLTRIAELEKALRAVSIIDLGFGEPKYFCAACVSYGDGPESITHKPDCVTARTLHL